MSCGQVPEAADVLARNDDQPVESGAADHDNVAVDVLRDLASRTEVGYHLSYNAAATITGQGALAGDQ